MENQKKIIIAFIFTLALVGAVALWMLVLNKGTASVHLEAPFSIQIGNTYKQCSENPCEIKINAYKYSLKIEKAGFFPIVQKIQLKRWQIIDIYPKPIFIPYIQEEEKDHHPLPENIHVDNPIHFSLEEENKEKIEEFKNIETYISPSGNHYLIVDDGIKLQSGDLLIETSIKKDLLAMDWGTDENIVFIQPEGDIQKMYDWDRENEPKLITQFQNLKFPSIFAGKDTILVSDKNSLFKVNVQKKRKELIGKDDVQLISWNPTGTAALVETEMEGLPLISLFSSDEGDMRISPIQSSLARIVWISDDEMLFVTFQELNDDLRSSFQEIGLSADELAGNKKEVLIDHLMSLNYRTGKFTNLLEIPSHIHIQKIEISEDFKRLLCFTDENRIRTIRLSE